MKKWHYQHAANVIHQGGIVAYPTEGVFGFGCDPMQLDAIKALLHIKHRSAAKGLIIIADSLNAVSDFIEPSFLRDHYDQLNEHWPGPITLICQASWYVPTLLTGHHQSVAIRVTNHPVAAQLCATFGAPIVSTSANRSGKPPATNAFEVRTRFSECVDYVLPGTTGGLTRPTPILNLITQQWIRH